MTAGLEKTSCAGGCAHGFNFCFWAKLIVGVPAVSLASALAAMQFADPVLQLIAAGVMAIVLAGGAVWLDRLKVFSGKVRPPEA